MYERQFVDQSTGITKHYVNDIITRAMGEGYQQYRKELIEIVSALLDKVEGKVLSSKDTTFINYLQDNLHCDVVTMNDDNAPYILLAIERLDNLLKY